MLGHKKLTLSVSLNWIICVFALAVILIFLYLFGPPTWKPALVFVAAVLAAASTLANAANGLDSRGSQAEQARIVAAMGFIERWNSPTFFFCKKNGRAVTDYFQANSKIDVQLAYLQANPDHLANLIDLLNTFEALSIGIDRNIVHEETAKQFFRSIVIRHWHLTEGYIRNKRAERQNARLNKEFESLFERWKD